MKRNIILLFLLLLICELCYSQNKLDEICLDYNTAPETFPSFAINIKLYEFDTTGCKVSLYYKEAKVHLFKTIVKTYDTIYHINLEQYSSLLDLINNLNLREILSKSIYNTDPVIYTHPTSVTFSIKNNENTLSLIVLSPQYDVERRCLVDFIHICNKIFIISNLNPKKFKL